jgi:hypothetical protein
VAEERIIDWESIEREYRAGIKTLREIAADFGITHGAINKRSIKCGWARDLTAKIQAKADLLVSRSEVSKSVSKNDLVTEREIIEANANIQATIQLRQRGRIQKHQDLGEKLLAELEAQTAGLEDFENLAELMKSDAGVDKLNEIYKKVIGTPGRIDSFKKLSESLKTLVGLERQAFGMADNSNGDANSESITVLFGK